MARFEWEWEKLLPFCRAKWLCWKLWGRKEERKGEECRHIDAGVGVNDDGWYYSTSTYLDLPNARLCVFYANFPFEIPCGIMHKVSNQFSDGDLEPPRYFAVC